MREGQGGGGKGHRSDSSHPGLVVVRTYTIATSVDSVSLWPSRRITLVDKAPPRTTAPSAWM